MSCSQKKPPDMILDPIFKNAWEGSLMLTFSNTLPPWNENSKGMKVHIDNMGIVTIEEGSLEYNGEIIFTKNSKIKREGFWKMSPVGILKTYDGVNYLDVDANINVTSDVQRVYAKKKSGNWILVNTVDFTGTPDSTLSFVFDDAVTGSTVGVNTEGGSIVWTLTLTPALVP